MEKKPLETLFKECAVFEGLKSDYLKLLAGCASNVRFDTDHLIFREGDKADQFYWMRQGLVSLEINAAGRGPIKIQTVEAGDVLGWSWLFPPYRWHFDARVLEPVHAMVFDGKCLRQKCEEDFQLGYELMRRFARIMMERLQATRLQMMDIYGSQR